ncbi:hypothetical protein [Rathayibacter tritici]|uniref:hypothetical protein n=1 Tax=Rathayibacter tritici TaxID=33888 RepID=UPI000CE73A4D|nr:hypothetical protein [Rathayibacter tritici]PPI47055.1 hypothetical protein C5D18_04735 [Rathayibacter tritici]
MIRMAQGSACLPLDFGCIGGTVVSQIASDAWQQTANSIYESYGRAIASLGTFWVYLPSPNLAGDSAGTATTPPGGEAVTTLLQYAMWICAGLAVLGLMGFGAWLGWQRSHGGNPASARLGFILGGTILIGSAGALIAGLLPTASPGGANEIVAFLQGGLWYYTGGLAILAVILAGARMVWEQRGEPAKELLASLLRLIVVAGAGVTVISLGTQAADQFSVWIINASMDGCDVAAPVDAASGGCFGQNIVALIGLTSAAAPIGAIGVVIACLLAIILSLTQIVLMVIRGGMLVLCAGLLPTAAAMSNTPMGKQWWNRLLGWTIAFILYKPAAAFVYAAAFKLMSSNVWQKDGGGFVQIMTGLALMLMALVAMPALLRFVTPTAIGSGSGGAAGAMALAAGAGAIADGAIRSLSHSSTTSSSSKAPTGPDGAAPGAAVKAAMPAATSGSAGAAAAGPVGAAVVVAGGAVRAGTAAAGAARHAVDESANGGN